MNSLRQGIRVMFGRNWEACGAQSSWVCYEVVHRHVKLFRSLSSLSFWGSWLSFLIQTLDILVWYTYSWLFCFSASLVHCTGKAPCGGMDAVIDFFSSNCILNHDNTKRRECNIWRQVCMYQSNENELGIYKGICVNVNMTYSITVCTNTGVGYNSNPRIVQIISKYSGSHVTSNSQWLRGIWK